MEIWIVNLLLILALLAMGFIITLILVYGKRENEMEDHISFEPIVLAQKVKDIINEIINQDVAMLNLNESETQKREEQRKILKNSMRNCVYGGQGEKSYLKDYIRDLLQKKLGVTEDTINECLEFENPEKLSSQDMFDVMMYMKSKKNYKTAFLSLAEENNWLEPKEDEEGYRYIITEEDIKQAYSSHIPYLSYSDKLEILSYRIYSFFGHGVIDMLRDNAIDGIAGGQGGLAAESYDYRELISGKGDGNKKHYAYDSIWVQAKGIWIHLAFMSFQSAQELERVTRALIKYDAPYELTRNRPKIFTDMIDGSRVTAMRPPLSETWTFFVRKFESAPLGLENSYVGVGADILVQYLKFLVKGSAHIAITGAMGSGKTTLLKELIRYINPTYNIRTSETMFELNVRKILPDRNIVPFRETEAVSMEELLDSLKKTDASCILLGEVSTEQLAYLSTQLAKITEQQLLTCHPSSTEGLISYFRQALMNRGSFTSEELATEEVVRSIYIDIHTCKDTDSGMRYVEYINEILPKGQVRNLLYYRDGEYLFHAAPSETLMKRLMKKLRGREQSEFKEFLRRAQTYRRVA